MAITSKREVARVLRIEADNINRHGLDDVSTYTYDCIQAQALRGERCTMKHKIVTRLKNLAMGLEAAELAEKQ